MISTQQLYESQLIYDQASKKWEEALPIGNGRLGAMVFGDVYHEQIQLNEDSLWHGGPRDRHNPDALSNLDEIRKLILEGRLKEAERLASLALTSIPETQRHYEPLGDLSLKFAYSSDHPVTAYRRYLDLAQAITGVSYQVGEVAYQRQLFASYPDDAIVCRMTADTPGQISFSARLGRGRYRFVDQIETIAGHAIAMSGQSGDGVKYCGVVHVVTQGGEVGTIGEHLVVTGADSAILVITAATSFRETEPKDTALTRANQVAGIPYEKLLNRHLDDYQPLYQRTSLKLLEQKEAVDQERDTSVRLEQLQAGQADVGLAALYFHFGRYLLIASSRPGSLPANLQGIWNKDMVPAWDSKFTININAQMNYWPAESCNLSECHLPLLELTERLAENGRVTAQTLYGCGGSTAHHNTDIWADSAPQDMYLPSTYWPLGLAWLSLHGWEHYLYGRDVATLQRTYPIMKEAAVFLLDYLITLPTGELVTCPSVSPENVYRLDNGESGVLCYGPYMDTQIIKELFQAVQLASDELGVDDAFRARLQVAMDKLPEPRIGRHGQLQEWYEDYEEVELGHRHISHLFALHPGTQMSPETTPELCQAARRTLERRLASGGGHTGWSRAWIINFWARLQDSEEAYANLNALLCQSTLPNLLDNHPPFQIDGNFGGTAGIVEMLLQSHQGNIHLLPALPAAWADGDLKGARARGGVTVDISWRNGRLANALLKADHAGTYKIKYQDLAKSIGGKSGADVQLLDDNTLTLQLNAGEVYTISIQG